MTYVLNLILRLLTLILNSKSQNFEFSLKAIIISKRTTVVSKAIKAISIISNTISLRYDENSSIAQGVKRTITVAIQFYGYEFYLDSIA